MYTNNNYGDGMKDTFQTPRDFLIWLRKEYESAQGELLRPGRHVETNNHRGDTG